MPQVKSVFVILLLATALNSKAQYKFLLRGEPSPFDSAVAVRLDRYRVEGLKLSMGQDLIDSLVAEIYSIQFEGKLADSIHTLDVVTIAVLNKAVQRKDSVNTVYYNNFVKLAGMPPPSKPFFKQPTTWIIAASVFLNVLQIIFGK